jgi:F-type H+-transporting ATPase subunit b
VKKEGAAPHADAEHGHDAADNRSAFLRQLAEQGLWTIVVFLVLLFVLRRVAWGPMLEGLNKREETIQRALDEAQRAQDEARTLREQLQREMGQASDKVRALMDEARRDAQHTADEMVAKARGEIQSERDRLRRELDTARDQALQELWQHTANLATLISAKAIGRNISEEDHRRLVDEALAELPKAGANELRTTAAIRS